MKFEWMSEQQTSRFFSISSLSHKLGSFQIEKLLLRIELQIVAFCGAFLECKKISNMLCSFMQNLKRVVIEARKKLKHEISPAKVHIVIARQLDDNLDKKNTALSTSRTSCIKLFWPNKKKVEKEKLSNKYRELSEALTLGEIIQTILSSLCSHFGKRKRALWHSDFNFFQHKKRP